MVVAARVGIAVVADGTGVCAGCCVGVARAGVQALRTRRAIAATIVLFECI
jgi:hypothetical protein